MSRKGLTTDQYVEKLEEKYGKGHYELLTPYKNARTKVELKHLICGHTFSVKASNMLSNPSGHDYCPYCRKANSRKTPEQFAKEVKAKYGDEYTLLTPYVKATQKIKVKHNKCGHTFSITPSNLLSDTNCPYCSLSKRRLSQSDYEAKVKAQVGDEYTVIGKYINMRTKIKMKHNKCEHIYEVRAESFLGGDRCPYCSSNTRKTTEWFKQKVTEMYGNEYTVLGEYVTSKDKIKIMHNVCGNIWYPIASQFVQGISHCPKCSRVNKGENRRSNIEDLYQRLNIIHKGKLEFDLSNYRNQKSRVKYHCNVCSYSGEMAINNALGGHGCSHCANLHRNDNTRLSIPKLKEAIKQMYPNGEYELLSNYYHNSYTKLTFKHTKCGNNFVTTWNAFRSSGVGCPKCQASTGENKVMQYLNTHEIDYQYAYLIPDLKDQKSLHFDFWLPQYQVAIEYDGIQHYIPTQFNFEGTAKAKQVFNRMHKHDLAKNDYCANKGIKLIRIAYNQSVKKVLDDELLPIVAVHNNDLKLMFKEVPISVVRPLMLKSHYLHRTVATKFSYALYANGKVAGMITYTQPRESLAHSISDQATKDNTLELSRLYIKDYVSQNIPNITSKFVGWSLRQLKQHGNYFIISFADSGMHHIGSIYQATNFLYCGMTSKSNAYAWNGYGKHGGHWEKGHYYRYMIMSSQKYRYVTFVGNKRFKKQARKSLTLTVQSYPKGDEQHYQEGETEVRYIRDKETNRIYREDDLQYLIEQGKLPDAD